MPLQQDAVSILKLCHVAVLSLFWFAAWFLGIAPWMGIEHGGVRHDILLYIAMSSPIWAFVLGNYVLIPKSFRTDPAAEHIGKKFVGLAIFAMCLISFFVSDERLIYGDLAEQAHYDSAGIFELERPHPKYIAQNPESLQEFEEALSYLRSRDYYETARYEAYGRFHMQNLDRLRSNSDRYLYFTVLLVTALHLTGVISWSRIDPSA